MIKKILLATLITLPLIAYEIIIDKTSQVGKKSTLTRDNSKEIVIDRTGLMWQDDSRAKSVELDWEGAKAHCQNLTHRGYNDWYLPSISELESLADYTKSPAIKEGFKNVASSYYWSSSLGVSDSKGAWGVYFRDDGYSGSYNKTYKYYVRCARAGQSDTLNFDKLISTLVDKELKNISAPPAELKLVKDDFETTSDFNKRVAKTKEKQKIIVEEYKKKYQNAKQKAKDTAVKKALEITWGKPTLTNLKYDADNGYFVADISFEAKKDFAKKVAIKVERQDAKDFKAEFDSLKPQAIFDYDGSSVKLKDIRVPYKKQTYLAQFTDMNIDDTRIAVNIKNDVNVDKSFSSVVTVAGNEVTNFDASKLKNFNELDNLLKKSKQAVSDKKKWLFVVGIEKYAYTDNISYAQRSAEMFAQTMQKTAGVPKENSFILIDNHATQAEIKTNLKRMLSRIKSGDTIYFYYNGHGVPVPTLNNEPFMLPSNSEPDYIADEKYFSLQNIYSQLSDSKAAKVVAVVDSCFSGVTDGNAVLKGVAATKIVAKKVTFDKEKMVVITAGNSHQYSNGYDKKGYRLFSFFVIKNILNGDTNIKDLYKNSKQETYDASLEEYGNGRTQDPQIDGNIRMSL